MAKFDIKRVKPLLLKKDGKDDLDSWLSEFEENLKAIGYKRYNQKYKNENFSYWKTYNIGSLRIYQVGILFYDYREFTHRNENAHRIGLTFECQLLGLNRIDMTVSKDIDLPEFEEMAVSFYDAMRQFQNIDKLNYDTKH